MSRSGAARRRRAGPRRAAPDDAYRLTEDEVLERFGTRREGLTSAEVRTAARRVRRQRHRAGAPRVARAPVPPPVQGLDHRAAADLRGASPPISATRSPRSCCCVLVLLNTSIGFFQEYRSGKTMDALQHLSLSLSQVTRDGRLTELDSTELVVGDVVRLTEGASVPADIRLIEASAFSTNEFALTGESDPTRKYTHAILTDVMVAERHNTAHAGTTVATGEAVGVVVVHRHPFRTRPHRPARRVGAAEPEPPAARDAASRQGHHLRGGRPRARAARRRGVGEAAVPRGRAVRGRLRQRRHPAGAARRGEHGPGGRRGRAREAQGARQAPERGRDARARRR